MDQVSIGKKRKLNCKAPIITFSIIALFFALCSSGAEVLPSLRYIDKYIILDLLFSLIFNISPCVLMVLYIIIHNKPKVDVIISIIFGIIAITPLCSIVWNYLLYDYFIIKPINLLFYIIPITVTFTLATISLLKGFISKLFPIIATIVGLIVEILFIIIDIDYVYYLIEEITEYSYITVSLVYGFSWIANVLGAISLYIALLLFSLKNTTTSSISYSPQKIGKMAPEQALKILKDKFDVGIITEEEYQAQRAEIISRL